MSVLVAFGHRARSGKDTAVAAIKREFGGLYHIERTAFADSLKREYVQMCEEAGSTYAMFRGAKIRYGIPEWVQYEFDADMSDPICGKWGKQRRFLQWWGEYKRQLDSAYWIKKLADGVRKTSPQFALIPDLRYQNEAAFVKMCGGFTVKVLRAGLTQFDSHISEHDLDDFIFDFELVGKDGDKAGLETTATQFFAWLLEHLNPRPVSAVGGALGIRTAA